MASMLQNMIRLGVLPDSGKPLCKSKAKAPAAIPPTKPLSAIYVSTGLKVLTPSDLGPETKEYEHDGVKYRRLDPEYLAWLQERMFKAQAAHRNGKLPDKQWQFLRESFNAIQAWAKTAFTRKQAPQPEVEQSDEEFFTSAGPAMPARREPEGWCYPQSGSFPFFETVPDASVQAVMAIRDEALSKGWSEACLLQNRAHLLFPIGHDWGLVCFLKESREIRSVSHKFIEIVHHEKSNRTSLLRFQNPDLMRGSILSQGEHNATLRQCPGDPSQGAPRRSPEALLRKPVDPASQSVLRQPQRTRAPVIPKRNHHQGNLSLGKPDHKTSLPNSSRSSSNR
jgi:hypothetical protein